MSSEGVTTRRGLGAKGSAPPPKQTKKMEIPILAAKASDSLAEMETEESKVAGVSERNPLTTSRTERADTVEAAGHFKHHRNGCNTGYVHVKDIESAIPELDLLRELIGNDFNGAFMPTGMKQSRSLDSESDVRIIERMKDWYENAFTKLRDHAEATCFVWVHGYDTSKHADEYSEAEQDILSNCARVLKELDETKANLDVVFESLYEFHGGIGRKQIRAEKYMRKEMSEIFMCDDAYAAEVGEHILLSIPTPFANRSIVEIAKHELCYVLYMRIRAKMIDRFEITTVDPVTNDEKEKKAFYHRLWNSGVQVSFSAIEPSPDTPAVNLSTGPVTDTVIQSGKKTSVRGVNVHDADKERPLKKTAGRGEEVTNLSTAAKKSVKASQKKSEDNSDSMNAFLADDDASIEVDDETNSDNREASDDSFVDEEVGSNEDSDFVPSEEVQVRIPQQRPQRKAAAQGIAKRQETAKELTLHELMVERFMQCGGDEYEFYELPPERLEAIKRAVLKNQSGSGSASKSSSVSSTMIRKMSGEEVREAISSPTKQVSTTYGKQHRSALELPMDLFDGYDDQSWTRISQLTSSSSHSVDKDKRPKKKKSSKKKDDDEASDEAESDKSEDEEADEEASDHLIGGGDSPDDGDDDDSSSDSSESTASSERVKIKNKKKGKKSKSIIKTKEDDENLYGEGYAEKFSSESKASRDNLLKANGSFSGIATTEEKWRYDAIKKLMSALKKQIGGYESTAEITKMFQFLSKGVDIIKLTEYKQTGASVVKLGNQPGRSVYSYLRDALACNTLGEGNIRAVVNLKLPIGHFTELYRLEGESIKKKIEKLNLKQIRHGDLWITTLSDLSKDPPTLAEVEYECKLKFHDIEANLGSEYRKAKQSVISDGSDERQLYLLDNAYEEKKAQIQKGFVSGVAEELKIRLENYREAKAKAIEKQRSIDKLKGELASADKMKHFFAQLSLFMNYVFSRLRSAMGTSEVYTQVQAVLNKTVKFNGQSTSVHQPFTEGNLIGIWHNVQEHYLKGTMASYFDYRDRKQTLLGRQMDTEEKFAALAVLEAEATDMHYENMPQELIELSSIIMAAAPEERRDVLKFIYAEVGDMKDKSPKEVGPYLTTLGLKEKVIDFMTNMKKHVYSGISTNKSGERKGSGYYGGTGDDEDEEGEGYSGNTSDKKSSSGKSKGKDKQSSGSGKSYQKSIPSTAGWKQVGSSSIWTTYKETLPIPPTLDVLPSQDVYCCERQQYDSSTRFTSTAAKCAKCEKWRAGGTAGKPPHSPACFLQECRKCHRFGHMSTFCLHQV